MLQVQVQMKCLNLPFLLGVSSVPVMYATRLTILSVLRLHHYPCDDHLISCDTYPASLSTAANLSLIHSFSMVEYTHTEYTDMVLVYGKAAGNGRAACWIYQERNPHRVTPSHTLFAKVIQLFRERGIFTINRVIVVLQGGVTLPTLKRTYCIALKRPRQRVPNPFCMEWVCLIEPSGRFCMSSNYTLPSPEGICKWSGQFCTPC